MNEIQLPAPHHGKGHRARLRQRLLNGKGDGLHDHELVEYLLALAIPRKDTKPLAKNLLDQLSFSKPPACDEAAGRFLGLSFAGWNVIVSAIIAFLAFRAAMLIPIKSS